MNKALLAALPLLALAASPVLADEPTNVTASGTLVAQMPTPVPPPPQPAIGWFPTDPPTFSWAGPYLGIQGGGSRLHSAGSLENAFLTPIPGALVTAVIPPVAMGGGNAAWGGAGGVTLGFNWQFDAWVIGIEGDASASSGSTNQNCSTFGVAAFGVGFTSNCHTSLRGFATLGPRIGYAIGNFLPYIKGGAAWADFHQTVTSASAAGVAGPAASVNDSRWGYNVGGGVEYGFMGNWSAKLEYDFMDFGNQKLVYPFVNVPPFVPGIFAVYAHTPETVSTIKLGLNYHFNAPAPPPPAPAAAPAPPPQAPKVFIVFFDWDKDVITPEGEQIIQQAADAYKSGAPVQLQVTGYTDRSGSPGYNQRLSERRANNVARALAALGVPKNEMVVSGRGENDNRVPTAPGVREPQNRRVEIVAP